MPTHGSRQQHKDDQAGIQMLMAAEQEAQQIVNSARNSRSSRMRQAKDEAERELSQYRASRETAFRRKLSEATGDTGQFTKRLELETLARLQKLNYAANQTSTKVTDLLIKWVITCSNDNIKPVDVKDTDQKADDKIDKNRKADEKPDKRSDEKIDNNILDLL